MVAGRGFYTLIALPLLVLSPTTLRHAYGLGVYEKIRGEKLLVTTPTTAGKEEK